MFSSELRSPVSTGQRKLTQVIPVYDVGNNREREQIFHARRGPCILLALDRCCIYNNSSIFQGYGSAPFLRVQPTTSGTGASTHKICRSRRTLRELTFNNRFPGCVQVFSALIQDCPLENPWESASCISFDTCFTCPSYILLDSEDNDNQETNDPYFHKMTVIMTFCMLFKVLPKDSVGIIFHRYQ